MFITIQIFKEKNHYFCFRRKNISLKGVNLMDFFEGVRGGGIFLLVLFLLIVIFCGVGGYWVKTFFFNYKHVILFGFEISAIDT